VWFARQPWQLEWGWAVRPASTTIKFVVGVTVDGPASTASKFDVGVAVDVSFTHIYFGHYSIPVDENSGGSSDEARV